MHEVSIEGTKVHPVRIIGDKRRYSAANVSPGGVMQEDDENRLCVAAGICATVYKTSIQDDSALNVLTITLQRAFARMGWAQPTIDLINEAMKVEWSRMLQDEPTDDA